MVMPAMIRPNEAWVGWSAHGFGAGGVVRQAEGVLRSLQLDISHKPRRYLLLGQLRRWPALGGGSGVASGLVDEADRVLLTCPPHPS